MELPRQSVAANARYSARAESTRPSNELCVVVRTSWELPELVQRNERVKERTAPCPGTAYWVVQFFPFCS